ncbi:tRNA (5-methylaminomethyl-2-thiouridine)(34)-methyltransferase MnmD [Paenirhodobacter enshiensis]|uniref:FAD-dependent oxidoreductase n=1 Tax=Paenirhodobacter enshiensis TaxID=1105367 RepID=A0A086XRW4_9RHOB|nr:tRNA (5-methylaminomethyl-2-thiouridine)(34)-methyltransferase MnmD [Paenirhodobacter enshiensis]KFI24764.1 FAD-dependent oxidoreductase [Paenirhodobacter enshiensis]
MTSPDQSLAALTWRDDTTPVSTRFDDPYFSLAGGLDEARHVFLAGNDLPERLHPGFAVAELGFGTGLNLIALSLLAGQLALPGPVSFTSFEAYPMSADEARRALSAFPEALSAAEPLLQALSEGTTRFTLGRIEAEIVRGDARETLPRWSGAADAWFLDGFSPAKNPELWEPGLMAELARHTRPGGSFATYSAAGAIRRALDAAGFDVTRTPGFAGKRHMSRGSLK